MPSLPSLADAVLAVEVVCAFAADVVAVLATAAADCSRSCYYRRRCRCRHRRYRRHCSLAAGAFFFCRGDDDALMLTG